MQPVTGFTWHELAVFALFLWFLYRHTSPTLAATLMAVGLGALIALPVDLLSDLLSLAAIGAGLGLLAHHLQQRRAVQQRLRRTPRSYTRPHDEFHH